MWAGAYLHFYCKFQYGNGKLNTLVVSMMTVNYRCAISAFPNLMTGPSNTDLSIIKLLLSEVYARQ